MAGPPLALGSQARGMEPKPLLSPTCNPAGGGSSWQVGHRACGHPAVLGSVPAATRGTCWPPQPRTGALPTGAGWRWGSPGGEVPPGQG